MLECWNTMPASSEFHIGAHRIVVAAFVPDALQQFHQRFVGQLIEYRDGRAGGPRTRSTTLTAARCRVGRPTVVACRSTPRPRLR